MSDKRSEGCSAPFNGCVRKALQKYLADLGEHPVGNLYELMLSEVEKPLLETVLAHVQGNQTRAAEMLGINRGTLRKKMAQYDIEL
ncbi:MAG TPA: DNA-binding transcriptional regulator Fis [Gammaproteobacteria bacterium]